MKQTYKLPRLMPTPWRTICLTAGGARPKAVLQARLSFNAAKIFIVMVLCRDNKHSSTFRPRKNTPMGSKVDHCNGYLDPLGHISMHICC